MSIPAGWRFVGFREAKPGEFYLNIAGYTVLQDQDIEPLKRTIVERDTAPKSSNISMPPGFNFVDFRPANPGETFLNTAGHPVLQGDATGTQHRPIVEKSI